MKIELRDSVQKFAEAMELVLRQNDHKGGWDKDTCDTQFLREKLVEEFGEVIFAWDDSRELIDLANIAMMLCEHNEYQDPDNFFAENNS